MDLFGVLLADSVQDVADHPHVGPVVVDNRIVEGRVSEIVAARQVGVVLEEVLGEELLHIAFIVGAPGWEGWAEGRCEAHCIYVHLKSRQCSRRNYSYYPLPGALANHEL